MINIKNLQKKYGKKIVLKNLSLDIKENSCLGLLGHNGAGKTTLIAIISGLISKFSGSVNIQGFDIKLDEKKVKSMIGVSIQDSYFDPDKSVYDSLYRMALLKGLNSGDAEKESARLIKQFKISIFKEKRIKELSHGMLQTLSIAHAFIGHPKLILLDEPLAGLDIGRKKIIRDIIIKNRKNSTMIISSHLLDEIELLCSDFIIIHKGKNMLEDKVRKLRSAKPYFTYSLFPIIPDIKKKLKSIKEIIKIEESTDNLMIHSKKDIYQKLQKFSKKNRCKIISMKSGKSIEDIFFETVN